MSLLVSVFFVSMLYFCSGGVRGAFPFWRLSGRVLCLPLPWFCIVVLAGVGCCCLPRWPIFVVNCFCLMKVFKKRKKRKGCARVVIGGCVVCWDVCVFCFFKKKKLV